MKRIIITENQYKKLVSQPLNEENSGGGKIVFSKGYGEDDIVSDRVWNFLNILKEKLWDKYSKNLFISEVSELSYEFDNNLVIVKINNGKYSNEEKRFIRNFIKRGNEYDGDFISYNKKVDWIFFSVPSSELKINQIDNTEEIEDVTIDDPEEIEDVTIDDPEEIEDVTIDDPEEIEDEPEDSDGACESGDCENGEGVYRYENGDVFDGLFKDGELDIGVYTYETGDIYEGVFENDVFNGEGTFIDIETGRKDYGMWEDGELNGEVIITYENLDVYEGNWENDTMNGDGKYLWENGNEYDGEWKDGERNGQGKFTFADPDGRIFEGIFEEDRFKDGTIKFPNGEEVDFEDFHVVVDDTDEEIEDETGTEEEETEIEDETGTEEEETEIEIIPGCECCTEENVNFYQENITNLKESNDFRWWVHQDEDRLKKVEDKLEDCGFNPTTDTNDKFDITRGAYEDVSEFMIIAFDEVGQEWIDDGKPEKPKMSIDDGSLIKPSDQPGGRDYGWRGKITSLCSQGKDRYCDWHWHNGEDYAYPKGTEIYVFKPGVVKSKRGHVLEIEHDNGSKTLYRHCDKYFVNKNDRVESGTLIGTVGNKGAGTGSHLHLEYWGPDATDRIEKKTMTSYKTNRDKKFTKKVSSSDPISIENQYIRFRKK